MSESVETVSKSVETVNESVETVSKSVETVNESVEPKGKIVDSEKFLAKFERIFGKNEEYFMAAAVLRTTPEVKMPAGLPVAAEGIPSPQAALFAEPETADPSVCDISPIRGVSSRGRL